MGIRRILLSKMDSSRPMDKCVDHALVTTNPKRISCEITPTPPHPSPILSSVPLAAQTTSHPLRHRLPPQAVRKQHSLDARQILKPVVLLTRIAAVASARRPRTPTVPTVPCASALVATALPPQHPRPLLLRFALRCRLLPQRPLQ